MVLIMKKIIFTLFLFLFFISFAKTKSFAIWTAWDADPDFDEHLRENPDLSPAEVLYKYTDLGKWKAEYEAKAKKDKANDKTEAKDSEMEI